MEAGRWRLEVMKVIKNNYSIFDLFKEVLKLLVIIQLKVTSNLLLPASF